MACFFVFVVNDDCLNSLKSSRYVKMDYRESEHPSLPHVVKFSGGRSSGMMLMTLLEKNILKPERGDVVVFNNTSAEHPKTYEFIRKCKEFCESNYKVPFFILEYCTYEDAYHGEYIRMPTFRLANSEPYSEDNPNGYRWRGEVYEELLSLNGVVPSIFQRTCTIALKLETTKNFLKEWFLGAPETKRRGHFGESPRIDISAFHRRHLKNRGSVPKNIFTKKKQFVLNRPHCRDSQYWSDFSSGYSPFSNNKILSGILGDEVRFGSGAVQYVSLIGLRADEERRVKKVMLKSKVFEIDDDNYLGEQVYAPLFEYNINAKNVINFWKKQKWDLGLAPDLSLSNCTFCFLKGTDNLRSVKSHLNKTNSSDLSDTPCDINWWVRIEEEYSKNFLAEGKTPRKEVTDDLIGFFGAKSGYLYKYISSDAQDSNMEELYPSGFIPCECTE